MKNEEFDDIIRNKLDSIEPAFAEADVDKVFQHVMKHKQMPLKWQKGKWYVSILTTTLLIGIFSWLITKYSGENTSKETATPLTRDEIRHPGNPVDSSKMIAPSPMKPVIPVTNPVSATNISAGIPHSNNQPASQYFSASPETTVKSQEKVTNEPTSEVISNAILATPFLQTETRQDSVTSVIVSESNSYLQTPSIEEKQSLPVPVQDSVSEPIQSPVYQDFPGTHTRDTLPSPGKGPGRALSGNTFRPIHLSGIYLNAAMPFSNLSFGPSLTGEFLVGKHFGISTGVKYSLNETESFSDRDDLYRHKHHGFNPRIEDHLKENDPFTSISIRNRIVQLPLILSYHISMKKEYSLTFSLGTDLDLYLNQKMEVTRPDTSHRRNDLFRAAGKVEPFNNLVFSTRIVKQWNRFGVYFNPYISPHLKEVFYKPKKLEYGIGLGITYRLMQAK